MDDNLKIIGVAIAIIAILLTVFGSSSGSKSSATKAKTQAPSKPKVTPRDYTAEEVAKHCKREDAWIIVEGKVYDITTYIDDHPGGESILKNVGKDSTEGFKGDQHPSTVWDVIKEYYIGNLKA